jgi:chemotaxis protein MotA
LGLPPGEQDSTKALDTTVDIATIIGLIAAAGLVVGSILLGGDLSAFIDVPSLLIVGGGTIAAALTAESLANCIGAIKVAMNAFKVKANDPVETIGKIVELSTVARREGIVALENAKVEDEFFGRALRMAADGANGDEINDTLFGEIGAMKTRHKRARDLFKFMAGSAPSMGMIGTLIGLVQMLQALDDPAAIGPAMAVALLTTMYGAIIAFMIMSPIATKLEHRSNEETTHMKVVVDGVGGIVAGLNAQSIRDRLEARLPPQMRQEQDAA